MGEFFEETFVCDSMWNWKWVKGNCLNSCRLAYSIGATTVEIASVIIARGFYRSIDANSVFMKGKRFYSLAAVTWGLIAELQKETEGELMRSMGKRRFELGAVKRILQSETFKGTIQCVPDLYPSNDDSRQNIFETAISVEEMNQDTFFNSGPSIPNLEKYFFDEVLNVTCKTKFVSFDFNVSKLCSRK
jgi:hypothetical protein